MTHQIKSVDDIELSFLIIDDSGNKYIVLINNLTIIPYREKNVEVVGRKGEKKVAVVMQSDGEYEVYSWETYRLKPEPDPCEYDNNRLKGIQEFIAKMGEHRQREMRERKGEEE